MAPAPVSVAGLDSALLPFVGSTMLPAGAYTSDEVHQLVTTIARGYRDGALPV